jgi:hypothetical protein
MASLGLPGIIEPQCWLQARDGHDALGHAAADCGPAGSPSCHHRQKPTTPGWPL